MLRSLSFLTTPSDRSVKPNRGPERFAVAATGGSRRLAEGRRNGAKDEEQESRRQNMVSHRVLRGMGRRRAAAEASDFACSPGIVTAAREDVLLDVLKSPDSRQAARFRRRARARPRRRRVHATCSSGSIGSSQPALPGSARGQRLVRRRAPHRRGRRQLPAARP